jgi:hypothetical protein
MALEDVLEGNVLLLVAAGAAVLVLPKVFPELPEPVKATIKGGLSLFLEAEAEVDGGIADKLVQGTLSQLLQSLSGPGTNEEKRNAAQRTIKRFQETARGRSRRHGWNDADRAARYRRHVAKLKRAIAEAKRQHPKAHTEILDDAARSMSEDW